MKTRFISVLAAFMMIFGWPCKGLELSHRYRNDANGNGIAFFLLTVGGIFSLILGISFGWIEFSAPKASISEINRLIFSGSLIAYIMLGLIIRGSVSHAEKKTR